MRIKKHKSQNEYAQTPGGVWVRNLANDGIGPVDINTLTRKEDYGLLLKNELTNTAKQIARIDLEKVNLPNVVIVSDGHGFAEKHELLAKLPKNVAVIAVNGALAKWKLSSGAVRRGINFYVVNNPYRECVGFLPKKNKYYPKCISSTRTNPDFIRLYKGVMYQYMPVFQEDYSGMVVDCDYQIDDYRNPVCAAVGLAHRFGVEKLLLFCCDEAMSEERPGAVQLPRGGWAYPQQIMAQQVVDANLYWLKKREDTDVETGVFGTGPDYEHAKYISEEEIGSFFAAE